MDENQYLLSLMQFKTKKNVMFDVVLIMVSSHQLGINGALRAFLHTF